ncbi:LLM class flavin-dependent oxidoreductase [Micromonospora okii]|uniref:LLM class flavin-dependent oxidoreductase n=1 Tax=Micromonospora okii TaxID=1182970 RepID=UPI0027952CC2|nr:LLM class flavin-dependent oxidoreductase [Micromonospora okii]
MTVDPPTGATRMGVRVFAISPRDHDPASAWTAVDATIRLADRHGLTGVLAHVGNDTLVDPWTVAHHALATSAALRPLVAVNPVYQHPFATAQLAASLTYRYQRPLLLNLVAGTSVPDRLALGDPTEHDDRYARLREYAEIVFALLDGTPVSRQGRFYQVRGARLRHAPAAGLSPQAFVAGESAAARECARALGAGQIGMFRPRPQPVSPDLRAGRYAGMIARETDDQAWRAALRRYPLAPELEAAGAAALRYTDATWRHRAFREAAETDAPPSWFWSAPMRSLRADCPFLVGGVDTLAAVLASEISAGADTFILDLAAAEEDFRWAAQVLDRAATIVHRAASARPSTPGGAGLQ